MSLTDETLSVGIAPALEPEPLPMEELPEEPVDEPPVAEPPVEPPDVDPVLEPLELPEWLLSSLPVTCTR
jgi:hypothetical protein